MTTAAESTEFTERPAYTLAVCTYNRAESLRRTLQSVEKALEASPSSQWEILVVDNNSSDHTADVCRDCSSKFPLRYVFEPQQGLSYARNRAIAECRGDLLAFTDDDVVIDGNWLAQYETCQSRFPNVGFVGGRIKPLWLVPRPAWLKDEAMPLISGLLVNYDLGTDDRWLDGSDPIPFGASFAVTRQVFEKVGSVRCDLGVKGGVPGRGEEADYLSRARSAGFEGAYLASALCYHSVDPNRLSLKYLYTYGVQKGVAETRMRRMRIAGTMTAEIGYALRGLNQLVCGKGDRFRQCVINMGIQRGLRRGQS